MYQPDIKIVPGVLSTSVLIILWWVALWLILEESISFLSGDKRHRKIAICVIIIVIITIYAHIYPHFLNKL